jgi:hypothetical protein
MDRESSFFVQAHFPARLAVQQHAARVSQKLLIASAIRRPPTTQRQTNGACLVLSFVIWLFVPHLTTSKSQKNNRIPDLNLKVLAISLCYIRADGKNWN